MYDPSDRDIWLGGGNEYLPYRRCNKGKVSHCCFLVTNSSCYVMFLASTRSFVLLCYDSCVGKTMNNTD